MSPRYHRHSHPGEHRAILITLDSVSNSKPAHQFNGRRNDTHTLTHTENKPPSQHKEGRRPETRKPEQRIPLPRKEHDTRRRDKQGDKDKEERHDEKRNRSPSRPERIDKKRKRDNRPPERKENDPSLVGNKRNPSIGGKRENALRR